jgi:hypothetical protein
VLERCRACLQAPVEQRAALEVQPLGVTNTTDVASCGSFFQRELPAPTSLLIITDSAGGTTPAEKNTLTGTGTNGAADVRLSSASPPSSTSPATPSRTTTTPRCRTSSLSLRARSAGPDPGSASGPWRSLAAEHSERALPI